MHEEIGTVKWFGDSTKQRPGSDYGYITRNDNPQREDIKVYWKRLKCSVDNIKGQKGLLVYFTIGDLIIRVKKNYRCLSSPSSGIY